MPAKQFSLKSLLLACPGVALFSYGDANRSLAVIAAGIVLFSLVGALTRRRGDVLGGATIAGAIGGAVAWLVMWLQDLVSFLASDLAVYEYYDLFGVWEPLIFLIGGLFIFVWIGGAIGAFVGVLLLVLLRILDGISTYRLRATNSSLNVALGGDSPPTELEPHSHHAE